MAAMVKNFLGVAINGIDDQRIKISVRIVAINSFYLL